MKTKITLSGVDEHYNFPWHKAITDRTFSDNGLEVKWVNSAGGTGEMVETLRNKEVDACILLTEGVTKAIADGLPAKVVHVYVQSSLHWGVYVPVDSGINKFDELKGKKFAISRKGSGSHLMSYIHAQENGWSIKDELKFSEVGGLEGGIKALEQEECFAFLWEKYTTHPYVQQGRCKMIAEVATPWPCFTLAVHEDFMARNNTAVSKMVDIICDKVVNVKKDPLSVQTIADRYELEENQVAAWMDETEWNASPEVSEAPFVKAHKHLSSLGLIDIDFDSLKERLFV